MQLSSVYRQVLLWNQFLEVYLSWNIERYFIIVILFFKLQCFNKASFFILIYLFINYFCDKTQQNEEKIHRFIDKEQLRNFTDSNPTLKELKDLL